MKKILSLLGISKTFKDDGKPLPVLKDISLEINEGEFFVLLGPSGCGKSTLLRIMSGLEKSFDGKLEISPDIKPSDFAFVFQQFSLMPWLTVYENVRIGLLQKSISEKERREKIISKLRLFKLEKFANSYPHELSGGMKQRVGLARAFARDPKIIFMDEPFSELDPFTSETLREELLKIWEEEKITIIMVSHNIEEALYLADRIAVFSSLPGKIKMVIKNDLTRPRDRYLPEFDKLYKDLHQSIKEERAGVE